MHLHGLFADLQLPGDLLVEQPFGHCLQHLTLAHRQNCHLFARSGATLRECLGWFETEVNLAAKKPGELTVVAINGCDHHAVAECSAIAAIVENIRYYRPAAADRSAQLLRRHFVSAFSSKETAITTDDFPFVITSKRTKG